MLDTTTINNQVTGIKTAWYWHTGRRVDQWNKIENLETNTAIHGHLVFCFFFFLLVALGLCCCAGAFPRGYSLSWCPGFTMRYFPLWSTGSRHTGFSSCNMRAQQLSLTAPRHVESSRTRDLTCVSCIGRWVLIHCTSREVQSVGF